MINVSVCMHVCVCVYMKERERERERERVEAMAMQQVHEGKLSVETTPREEEGQQASKESKRGGWITFPFIIGLSLSLSLSLSWCIYIYALSPPFGNVGLNI